MIGNFLGEFTINKRQELFLNREFFIFIKEVKDGSYFKG